MYVIFALTLFVFSKLSVTEGACSLVDPDKCTKTQVSSINDCLTVANGYASDTSQQRKDNGTNICGNRGNDGNEASTVFQSGGCTVDTFTCKCENSYSDTFLCNPAPYFKICTVAVLFAMVATLF